MKRSITEGPSTVDQTTVDMVLQSYPYSLEYKKLNYGEMIGFLSYHWHKNREMFNTTSHPLRSFSVLRTIKGLTGLDQDEDICAYGPSFFDVGKTQYHLRLPEHSFFSFAYDQKDPSKICYILNYTNYQGPKEVQFLTVYFKTMDDLTLFVKLFAEWHENLNMLEKKELETKILMHTIINNRWRIASAVNNNSWSNVFISTKNREMLTNRINSFMNDDKKRALELGMSYKLNILLHGVPGSGKTTIVKTLSKVFKKRLYLFSFSAEMTDSKFIELFSEVRANSIVAFEDIDAFFNFRDKTTSNRQVNFSTFLNQLDGIQNATRGIITVLTANYVDRLDPALLRPGRMDLIMHFDYPKEEEVMQAFTFYTKGQNNFYKFYNYIKNLSIPMSGITSYLYRHPTDYIENIQELIEQYKSVKNIVDDKTKTSMYN